MRETPIDTRPDTVAIWVSLLRNSPHGFATLGSESRQRLADLLEALSAQADAQAATIAFLSDCAEDAHEAREIERAGSRAGAAFWACALGLAWVAVGAFAIAVLA